MQAQLEVLLEVGYEFLTNCIITCPNYSIVHVDRVVVIVESGRLKIARGILPVTLEKILKEA